MPVSGLYPWLLSRHQHHVLGSGEFLVTKQHKHEGKKWDLQKPRSFVMAISQNQWRNRHKWWLYNIINVCEIWCRLDLVSRDKPAQTWALGDDQFCLHLQGDSRCSPSRRTPVRNKIAMFNHNALSRQPPHIFGASYNYLEILSKQYHS